MESGVPLVVLASGANELKVSGLLFRSKPLTF
jgi:hypothetical protein